MSSVRWIIVALLLSGSLPRVARADSHVVLVVPPKTSGIGKADTKFMLTALSESISSHSGYSAADADEAAKAIDTHESITTDCLKDPQCMSAVADDVRADLIVQSRLSKGKETFLLETFLAKAADGKVIAKHAESMGVLKNMKLNADLCIKALLHSFESGAPPPAEPVAKAAPKPKAGPPPSDSADESPRVIPADSPEVLEPPHRVRAPVTASNDAPEVIEPPHRVRAPVTAAPPERQAPPPKKVAKAPPPPPPPAAKPAAAKAPRSLPKDANKTRIVVLDPDTFKGGDTYADRLAEMVVDALNQKKGYMVIGDTETQKAEKKHLAKNRKCLSDKKCEREIGKDVKADVLVGLKLAKAKGKYVLEMALAIVDDTAAPIHHTESMHSIKNLKMNVDLCVKSLFK